MVDSNYNLSLSSIESNEELSNSKFKKVSFNRKNYYDELVSFFYKNLPVDIAFSIKYDNDIDTVGREYNTQYDEIYQYGARNIFNNKDYKEEFEYFAPLYISPNNLPKFFIVFRVDGPGIESLDKENFKSLVLNKFKTVKVFDLTSKTFFGEWLNMNFNNNSFFPLTPFEMSFNNLEFSKWNGIDYENGGYISKSMFLQSIYEEEKEIFEFEKFIFDGYKNNKIVFPNILNISFLFDDTPANKDTLRKWSLNRYYGFYIDDMVKVRSISPYTPPTLKNDVIILDGNILSSTSGIPFVDGFLDGKIYYVEYNSQYYKVEKFEEVDGKPTLQKVSSRNVITEEYLNNIVSKFKIISDIDLKGKQSELNKNTGLISDSLNFNNILLNADRTNFEIPEWDTADVWLIEIDGMFHNLVREIGPELIDNQSIITTRIRINSDYSFLFNKNDYEYYINKSDSSYTKKVSFVVDENNPPKLFNIYKLKFTDVKDFDTRMVDTEYSKFEYEKKYELTETDETKIYLTDLNSKTFPKNYDDFIFNEKVVNIPVSSEYTANHEIFKIDNNNLNELWRKNSTYCRWGFQNSLSANDVPYLLNNSLIFEDFNRSVNPFDPNPKRIERNLDYFYTINSSTYSYVHHTLHVESQKDYGIDTSFKFELDKYLNLGTYSNGTYSLTYSFDYFSHFFEKNARFDNYKINKNSKKYSLFNSGNGSIPNITLFRGLKFFIYKVDDVKKNDTGKIDVLNLRITNDFSEYKFSILLSDNDWMIVDSPLGNNRCVLTQSQNMMNWTIFDEWKMDKSYQLNDIVIKDDILYISNTNNNLVSNPTNEYSNAKNAMSAPYNQTSWSVYTPNFTSIFWNPTINYTIGSVVYNGGDYYYYYGGAEDFWNPIYADQTGYAENSVVLFKGRYYISMTSSNHHRPDFRQPFEIKSVFNQFRSSLDGKDVFDQVATYYWMSTQPSDPKWQVIKIWNPSIPYTSGDFVVHNSIVYRCILYSDSGIEPGISSNWLRVYSLIPDTNLVYNSTLNPIIEMNNSYYMINSNISNSTLQNGINIYINKKWKNVLINIDIADNTIPGISETDRDYLYSELNTKLTAYNFVQCINDISNKYGFTDYINYIIIEEDGSLKRYNYENIEGLPFIITCELPDDINIKVNSLDYRPISVPKELKPKKLLKSIEPNLSNINFYNNNAIANEIRNNKDILKPSINYSSTVNLTNDIIYRFSGFYMPIFYQIELFESPKLNIDNILIEENYKFDTTLSYFGIMKERKIRKVNHKENILKLYNIKNQKSIYPMLDEFGYTFVDSFIFRSTWDTKYHQITTNDMQILEDNESKKELVTNSPLTGVQIPIININL